MIPEAIKRQRGSRFLLTSACVVIVIAGLRAAEPILVPLLVAILLSILSSPLLDWLQRHHVPRSIAVFSTVLANFAVVAALLLPVGGSINAFTASLPNYQQRLEEMSLSTRLWLESKGFDTSELRWGEAARPAANDPRQSPEEGSAPATDVDATPFPQEDLINIAAVMNLVTGTLKGLAALLSKALLVLLIMVFILFEAATLPRRFQIALRWDEGDLARLTKAKREIQRYLGIKTLISLATGVLICLWLWLLNVEYPLLWGLIAFMLNYIPSLGSIFAAIPTVLLTLIEAGIGQALLVGLGYVLVNLALGNLIEPHLMGRRLGISTLVVFLSLIFWGWIWGPVGMLLAVPLTVILKIMLENTADFHWLGQLLGANPSPESTTSRTPRQGAPL